MAQDPEHKRGRDGTTAVTGHGQKGLRDADSVQAPDIGDRTDLIAALTGRTSPTASTTPDATPDKKLGARVYELNPDALANLRKALRPGPSNDRTEVAPPNGVDPAAEANYQDARRMGIKFYSIPSDDPTKTSYLVDMSSVGLKQVQVNVPADMPEKEQWGLVSEQLDANLTRKTLLNIRERILSVT